ncbi:MAG: GNAT family N-acetyltransferase [Rhodoblastus sp.]|nr:MAG: GNAT family N-acetyltransferase [Rhodoblastus sp.]
MFPDLTRDDVFRLETQRLWLRWPRASDAAALRRIFGKNDEPAPAGGAEAMILAARAANAQGQAVDLAITLKSTREAIGRIGARVEAGEIEIAYLVAAEHQDQGYAGEALAALTDVVFALTFAPRVLARVAAGDEASAHLLAKQGFAEARAKQAQEPQGRGLGRLFALDRATREGLRLRRVPAMTQQGLASSLAHRSVAQPVAGANRAHAGPAGPDAARGWM